MIAAIGRTLSLSVILVFLLAACTDSGGSQVDVGPAAADEPAAEGTSAFQPRITPGPTMTFEPAATQAPTAVIEPTAGAPEVVETGEALLDSPEFVLGDLVTYQVESTGLAFDYPAGWSVTENASGPIRIESEAGYGERIDTDAGAVVLILPMAAGDLMGQDSLEKLASYIIGNEPSPSTTLGDPTTMILNDQELTFSAFVDQAAGVEGVYAAVLAGDELAVVVAIAGGDSRTAYRPAVEAIVNSLILPQAE